MTNKHLRCSFFSGKGFFSYGQYFIFKTSEFVLWTTSKKALLDFSASSNQRTDTGVCTPACKDFEGRRSRKPSWQSLREFVERIFTACWVPVKNRRNTPNPNPHPPPSIKTVFYFSRHKNTQTVPPHCLQYTVPPHLWKRQAGLDG